MDLSLHPRRFPVTLEKWYVDALLEDGTVVLVYLGALTLYGMRLARVTAEIFPPSGQVVRGSAAARAIVGGPGILRFGAATMKDDRLVFRTAGLSGELHYQPRYPECVLREPFIAQGDRTLHWSVEIPDADVFGTLVWPGGKRAITGRGYRDRVWFDLSPWRFPIRELIWGRAIAGEHAAMWVRATTDQGIVAAGWRDGRIVMSESASGAPPGVEVGQGRVFLNADVSELESLRLGVLRGLVRRLSGDPHETKWQAPCTIEGVRGVAVHEVVQWRS